MHNKVPLTSADIGKRVLLRNGETATLEGDNNGNHKFPFTLRRTDGSLIFVTAEGAYWLGVEDPRDVVEVLDKPFTITPNDVGRTVRLRNGITAKITNFCQGDFTYQVFLDSGNAITSGGLFFEHAAAPSPLDAVAFVDGPVDRRSANAAKAVGRFLAIESERIDGVLVSPGLNIRGAFDTREAAEAFIKNDTIVCYEHDGGSGKPENFSGDWFIAEVKRAVHPVPVVKTETTCRLDTLAGGE